MEKIDIAKLLVCCSEGVELDCTLYEGVTFVRVDIRDYEFYPIKLKSRSGIELSLTKYGQYARHEDSKCVIFPKGKNTWEGWEGFVPPCKFKDGDICYIKTENSESIFIFEDLNEFDFIKRYVSLHSDTLLTGSNCAVCRITQAKEFRFATEEEKKTLFDAIKANGYMWDAETKTLKNLVEPEFKDGDIILRGRYIAIFWHIKPNGLIYYHCWYDTKYRAVKLEKDFGIGNINDKPMTRLATEDEKKTLFDAIESNGYKWNEETKTLEKFIKPEFKVGDIIQNKDGYRVRITEVNIKDEWYRYESVILKHRFESVIVKGMRCILFNEQYDWKLVPNKFNINDLKPFDKVLCRMHDSDIWECDLFSHYNDDDEPRVKFHCVGFNYRCCIPYDGNEHLLGTNMECDNFYKTWK